MVTEILLADKSEFMRGVLREVLDEAFVVLDSEATDGEEAVALYREHEPEIVVMEIAMPRCNGLKATAALRDFDPDARVVICTHVTDDEMREYAEQVGATAFITKPFERQALIDTVKESVMTVGSP